MKPVEFPGIEFEDSYVLGISIGPYQLNLKMDLVLTPIHPDYHPPEAGNSECFRKGAIWIIDFTRVLWVASGHRPSKDLDGEEDYGNLDRIVTDNGEIALTGDWGEISVTGGQIKLTLDEQ